MRVVTLEEHFSLPSITGRIPVKHIRDCGWPEQTPAHIQPGARLHDLDEGRLREMDEAEITVQILSTAGPGAPQLAGAEGIALAREYNDQLAAAIRRHPDRFGGFAHLPMAEPDAAADELERCVNEFGFCGGMVNGTTQGLFLDHSSFEPLLARAEALDVPLYLHPAPPPAAVRDAYYGGLPGHTGFLLSIAGWGWHAETALHVLRLALAGVLDRHRGLKLVVGHMGEGLPAMLARFDVVFTPETSKYLKRSVGETLLSQLWITTAGFFDYPSFMAAFLAFGADRVLFSVDYPYAPTQACRHFLDNLPVSAADKRKIAHQNADALLRLEK